MKNWTVPIYLYFIKSNYGVDGKFQDMIFLFHQYISLNNVLFWDRIFVFNEQRVCDNQLERTLQTLQFHQYVDANSTLTQKGEERLFEFLQDPTFSSAISRFEEQYNGEYAIEKSCFVSVEHFPAACHLCTNRVCREKTTLAQCFTSVWKPRKNPFRSYSEKATAAL